MIDNMKDQIEKALQEKDKEGYDKCAEELLSIGYLPILDEENCDIEVEFVGPLTLEEKKAHTAYLDNIYTFATEHTQDSDEDEDDEEPEMKPGFVGGFVVGVLVLGLVFMARKMIVSRRTLF